MPGSAASGRSAPRRRTAAPGSRRGRTGARPARGVAVDIPRSARRVARHETSDRPSREHRTLAATLAIGARVAIDRMAIARPAAVSARAREAESRARRGSPRTRDDATGSAVARCHVRVGACRSRRSRRSARRWSRSGAGADALAVDGVSPPRRWRTSSPRQAREIRPAHPETVQSAFRSVIPHPGELRSPFWVLLPPSAFPAPYLDAPGHGPLRLARSADAGRGGGAREDVAREQRRRARRTVDDRAASVDGERTTRAVVAVEVHRVRARRDLDVSVSWTASTRLRRRRSRARSHTSSRARTSTVSNTLPLVSTVKDATGTGRTSASATSALAASSGSSVPGRRRWLRSSCRSSSAWRSGWRDRTRRCRTPRRCPTRPSSSGPSRSR